MNAPVPPATDGQADPLKQPSQFPGGYGQGFSSQSESTVDQPDIPQETLQSGEGRALGGCISLDQVVYVHWKSCLFVWHPLYIHLTVLVLLYYMILRLCAFYVLYRAKTLKDRFYLINKMYDNNLYHVCTIKYFVCTR